MPDASAATASPAPRLTIGTVPVYVDGDRVTWTAGLAIDADGCPSAYAPVGSGLRGRDLLGNAGKPGHWWGLVCDEHGEPYVQRATDPAPGFYISPTALQDHGRPLRDPRRYVDSARVPYLSIPPELRELGVRLGDVARVRYRGQACEAIVADVGPHGKLGEGSIALANALGIPSDPRHGGVGAGVEVCVWAGSGKGWPRAMDDVRAQVAGMG